MTQICPNVYKMHLKHKAAIRRVRGKLLMTVEEERAASDFIHTEDFRNACRAFMEKRKPEFFGR